MSEWNARLKEWKGMEGEGRRRDVSNRVMMNDGSLLGQRV